ncbi:MAG: oligosaccharide flippase family protein [Pseudomonadota bacterium]
MASIADVRDVVRGGFASLGGYGGRVLARIAFLLTAGHFFGAVELGYLAQVAASVEILSAVGVMGLKRTLLGLLSGAAKEGRNVAQVVVEAVLAVAMLSLALTGIFVMAWPVLFPTGPEWQPILLLAIPSIVIADVALAATRYRRIMRWEVITRCVVEPWAFLALAGMLAVLGAKSGGLLIAYAGASFFAMAHALIGLGSVFGWRTLFIRRPRWKSVVSIPLISLPAGLTDIGVTLFRRIDVLLLGLVADPATLGVYYMVQQIATVPYKIHGLFDPMMAPVIAQLHHDRKPRVIEAKLAGVCRWIFTLQIGLTVPLVIFGDHALALFGSQFASGAVVLAIILLAELLDGSFILTEIPLIYAKPSAALTLIVAALVIEILAIGLMAPVWGAPGAAAGFLLAMASLMTGRLAMVRKQLSINVLDRFYWRPVLIATIIAAPLAVLRYTVTLQNDYLSGLLFAGALGCFLLMARMLATTRQDRVLLRRLRSRG